MRLVNPPHHSADAERSSDGYHSQSGKALLEIFSIVEGKKQEDFITVNSTLTNASKKELTIYPLKSYQWTAWYRWKRYPARASAEVLSLQPGEKKEVSWVFRRREFGVLIVPFNLGKSGDQFEVKFEYCSPWEDCKTVHQVK